MNPFKLGLTTHPFGIGAAAPSDKNENPFKVGAAAHIDENENPFKIQAAAPICKIVNHFKIGPTIHPFEIGAADLCYDFKRLRQSSTVIGSKV